MEEKRRGQQEPTTGFTLPYTHTRGSEAVEIYNKSGRTAQEWQEGLLYDMLAIDDEGLWVHSRFGYSVPRQNGKNEVVAMRELFGLLNGESILHTAHRTSTSRSAWERLVFLLESMGIQEERAANPVGYRSGKSKGQEFIFLHQELGGGRIQFRTRTTTGGLGETFDLLVIDEAQEYQDDQESALKYTIVSSSNPQTVYLGTPPTPYSSGTKFPEYRKKTLCGELKHAGWAEWSVDDKTDMHDIDAWYATNPSLGYKLTERAIEDEIGDDDVDFNIQRLGLWITYNQKSVISKNEWLDLQVDTLPKIVGLLSVGIKFNKDGSTVSMAIAGYTDDNRLFTEVVGCKSMRDGLDWLTTFLRHLEGNYSKVIVDGANGQELLTQAMKDCRLKKPYLPTVRDCIDANARFEQNMFKKKIVHMEQPAVLNIITNCDKRPIGSAGGFGYKSIKLGADVSIMDSMILALWGLEEFKEKKKQKISY